MPASKRLRLLQKDFFQNWKIIIGRTVSLLDEVSVLFHFLIWDRGAFFLVVELDDVAGRQ